MNEPIQHSQDATPRTDAACGSPSNDWEATAVRLCDCSMALERELNAAVKRVKRAEAAERHEAICHCGEAVSAHHFGSGHAPVPMEEECPYAAELGALHGQVAALREALEFYVENDFTPSPNCACHISPPCADCVEFSAARENLANARSALAATASVPPVPDPSDTLDSRGVAEDERNPVPPAALPVNLGAATAGSK